MLAQQILNGVVVGCVYALFSLGFTIIFGVSRVVNLAHGGIFMAGGVLGYLCVAKLRLPLPAALLFGSLGSGFISVALDYFAFRPLRKRHSDEFAAVVVSIGANLILINIAQQITDAQVMNFPFDIFPIKIFRFWGLRISLLQIAIMASAAILVIALCLYVFKSSLGTQVRAVAISERTASLLGVHPGFVYFQTFMIAGILAGGAGVILGVAFNSVSYGMGDAIMLRAFAVVILGGLGSIAGSIVAGLLLGIVHTIMTAYVSSQLADVGLFGLLIVVLLVRPTGLFSGLHSVQRRA
jgi:branched-chain amino acid transport system permease protein